MPAAWRSLWPATSSWPAATPASGYRRTGVGLFAAAGGAASPAETDRRRRDQLLAFTAAPIVAEEAYRIGLVDQVCDSGQALSAAIQLAETIARNAPLAVAASKRMVNEGWSVSEPEFWATQRDVWKRCFRARMPARARRHLPKSGLPMAGV